jgi:N-formylmaleamate deformylase
MVWRMLRSGLLLALAITVAACGGTVHPASGDEAGEDGVFVNQAGFEPSSFTVEVSGQGRPIIFIPGLGCPGEMWKDVTQRLDDRYQSHVLTLAGFAGNKPIKPPLGAKVRKELIRYIRSNKLESAIIVGHSFGGFIAYWLAETAPKDVVGGLVVVDAGPGGIAGDEEARLLRNMWAQAGDDELPVQIRAKFSWMTASPKKMEPFYDQIAKSDRQTIGDAIYEYVKTDIKEDVERIKAPSLIILADGGLQGRYTAEAAAIPNHEVVVLRGTKHFVWFDDPDGFTKTLDTFIRSTDDHTSASR